MHLIYSIHHQPIYLHSQLPSPIQIPILLITSQQRTHYRRKASLYHFHLHSHSIYILFLCLFLSQMLFYHIYPISSDLIWMEVEHWEMLLMLVSHLLTNQDAYSEFNSGLFIFPFPFQVLFYQKANVHIFFLISIYLFILFSPQPYYMLHLSLLLLYLFLLLLHITIVTTLQVLMECSESIILQSISSIFHNSLLSLQDMDEQGSLQE